MARVRLIGLSKQFGSVAAVRDVTLDIAHGELVALVGPSGCGKSTLLRMIAGLEEPSAGEVEIDGEVVNDVPESRRGVAMVFQSYALYPHMTVAGNIAFGLRMAGMPRDVIAGRVQRVAEILRIQDLLDRRPRALSGGQRQRAAIGRAIAREPKVFLFDEPLSNLDAALRVQMRVEIARLHEQLGATMVYVTHDQVEAMTLATRIVVLRNGMIEQVGEPLELYRRPANRFVAGFIGSPQMNFIPVDAQRGAAGATIRLPGGVSLDLPFDLSMLTTPNAILGVRPNHWTIGHSGLAGRVRLVERLGNVTYLYVDIDGLPAPLIVEAAGDSDIVSGAAIHLEPRVEHAHLFDSEERALARV